MDPSGVVAPACRDAGPRVGQRRLSRASLKFVDVAADEPTHWSIAGGTYGRLDRIYTSIPEWALLSAVTAGVWRDTLESRPGFDTDHAPTWAKAPPKEKLHSQRRPIPPRAFQTSTFKEQHEPLLRYDDLGRLMPFPGLGLTNRRSVKQRRDRETSKTLGSD